MLSRLGENTVKDKWFYLAIAVVVITAWMLRWEITLIGAEERTQVVEAWKLDKWTGRLEQCRYGGKISACTKFPEG
jgi:hypothetical protein